MALTLAGCQRECIDRFDCLQAQRTKQPVTCDQGRCVVAVALPQFPDAGLVFVAQPSAVQATGSPLGPVVGTANVTMSLSPAPDAGYVAQTHVAFSLVDSGVPTVTLLLGSLVLQPLGERLVLETEAASPAQSVVHLTTQRASAVREGRAAVVLEVKGRVVLRGQLVPQGHGLFLAPLFGAAGRGAIQFSGPTAGGLPVLGEQIRYQGHWAPFVATSATLTVYPFPPAGSDAGLDEILDAGGFDQPLTLTDDGRGCDGQAAGRLGISVVRVMGDAGVLQGFITPG